MSDDTVIRVIAAVMAGSMIGGRVLRRVLRTPSSSTCEVRSILRQQCRFISEEKHSTYSYPRLTRQQVSTILQAEEKSIEINHEAVLRWVLNNVLRKQ